MALFVYILSLGISQGRRLTQGDSQGLEGYWSVGPGNKK